MDWSLAIVGRFITGAHDEATILKCSALYAALGGSVAACSMGHHVMGTMRRFNLSAEAHGARLVGHSSRTRTSVVRWFTSVDAKIRRPPLRCDQADTQREAPTSFTGDILKRSGPGGCADTPLEALAGG